MRVRRNTLTLLVLGGVLAAAAILGVTQDVGATSGTGSSPGNEAPTIGELLPGDTDEAPKLHELPQPRFIQLTPKAMESVRKTIGKLYVTFPDGRKKEGTATIVESDSRDMVITAARLLTYGGQSPLDVRFTPGAMPVRAPHGHWYGREWATVPGSDVAMVLLYPHKYPDREDVHIQNELGGQKICFGCDPRSFVHVYGYPLDFLNGTALDTHCQLIADFSAGSTRPYGSCLDGEPVVGDDAEGSPVLAKLDPASGQGSITAIHTGVFLDAGRPAGAGQFLGRAAEEVYRELQGKSSDPVMVTIVVTNHGAFVSWTTVELPDGQGPCALPNVPVGRAEQPCPIPGGGMFRIHGKAVSGASKDYVVQASSALRLCFEYHGTTIAGFDFRPAPCA